MGPDYHGHPQLGDLSNNSSSSNYKHHIDNNDYSHDNTSHKNTNTNTTNTNTTPPPPKYHYQHRHYNQKHQTGKNKKKKKTESVPSDSPEYEAALVLLVRPHEGYEGLRSLLKHVLSRQKSPEPSNTSTDWRP